MIGLMVERDPKATKSYGPTTSAADPCHFGVDPTQKHTDPTDPQHRLEQNNNVSKLTAAAAAALLAPAAFSRGATGSSITSDRSLFDPTSSSLEKQIMVCHYFCSL